MLRSEKSPGKVSRGHKFIAAKIEKSSSAKLQKLASDLSRLSSRSEMLQLLETPYLAMNELLSIAFSVIHSHDPFSLA
jgi:hypothetical protein